MIWITEDHIEILTKAVRLDGKSRNICLPDGKSVRASRIRIKNQRRDVTQVVWSLDDIRIGINNLKRKLRALGYM